MNLSNSLTEMKTSYKQMQTVELLIVTLIKQKQNTNKISKFEFFNLKFTQFFSVKNITNFQNNIFQTTIWAYG